ncbi:hypothetical protein AUJ65_00215 [Candidatus Micrarchaeota archaeon CG1_02_51_15]|nr:MAG: hypothetical protein AUJ65_00215 [Candidatus Micrarchaeota archaeon CG1_02_51_15]
MLISFLFEKVDLDYLTYSLVYEGTATFIIGGLILELLDWKFDSLESKWLALSIVGFFPLAATITFFGLEIYSLHNFIFSIIIRIFLVLTTVYLWKVTKITEKLDNLFRRKNLVKA